MTTRRQWQRTMIRYLSASYNLKALLTSVKILVPHDLDSAEEETRDAWGCENKFNILRYTHTATVPHTTLFSQPIQVLESKNVRWILDACTRDGNAETNSMEHSLHIANYSMLENRHEFQIGNNRSATGNHQFTVFVQRVNIHFIPKKY